MTDAGPENNAPERKGGFQKGVSGNPGGRPKAIKELVEITRKHTPAAVGVLAKALKDKDPRVRVQAAQVLLDRAWGRAPQSIEHSGPAGAPVIIEFPPIPTDDE